MILRRLRTPFLYYLPWITGHLYLLKANNPYGIKNRTFMSNVIRQNSSK